MPYLTKGYIVIESVMLFLTPTKAFASKFRSGSAEIKKSDLIVLVSNPQKIKHFNPSEL